MPLSWPFTRKKVNTRSQEEIANQIALSQVQKKYGRVAPHFKVANIMRPNEGKHDPFEIERKELARIFLEEGQKKAERITQGQKEDVIAWATELKEKLTHLNGQRGGGNGDSVNMSIPAYIGQILLFIIGLGLIACSFFIVFLDIANAMSGGQSPGLSSLAFSQAIHLMNLSRPSLPSVVTANPVSRYYENNRSRPSYGSRRKNRRNRRA